MDISLFFDPVDNTKFGQSPFLPTGETLWANTLCVQNAADCERVTARHLVIFGVAGTEDAPTAIRTRLYQLVSIRGAHLADFGTLKSGESQADTLKAIEMVVGHFAQKGHTVILLGDGQEATYAATRALGNACGKLNIVTIDPRYDVFSHATSINAQNYLGHIMLDMPGNIFSIANIGNQNFYNSSKDAVLFDDFLYDTIRLGRAQENIKALEPTLRDADLLSIDLSAIRQSDAPAHAFPSTNGFFGHEACRMMRYAGMATRQKVVGFFGLKPSSDQNHQTEELVAQLVWHFVEGNAFQPGENPLIDEKLFKKFIVQTEDIDGGLVFYKSKTHDQWWIEVTYNQQNNLHKKAVACNAADYEQACQNEIPDIWWRTLQKIKRHQA